MDVLLRTDRMTLRRVTAVHFDDPIPGTEHGEVEYEVLRDEWRPVG